MTAPNPQLQPRPVAFTWQAWAPRQGYQSPPEYLEMISDLHRQAWRDALEARREMDEAREDCAVEMIDLFSQEARRVAMGMELEMSK